MDINCTHKCRHQKEGKCTLHNISELPQRENTASITDCPYCNLENTLSSVSSSE